MTCVGWDADGAVVNSTYAFCLSCIAAWSVIQKRTLPQPLARLLGSIPVHFTKHDSSTTRLLQNLVDSAVQHHTNRSVQCPVYIAEELNRLTSPSQFVKAVVKLYKQKMILNPSLQFPARMEDCVTTLMSPAKTCKTAFALLYRSVAKFSWDNGPWQISHIMSSFFALESPLNTSMHDLWQPLNVQTATGQTTALEIGYARVEEMGRNLIVRMSGLWCWWWLVVCG